MITTTTTTIVALKNFYKMCIGSYSFQKNEKDFTEEMISY